MDTVIDIAIKQELGFPFLPILSLVVGNSIFRCLSENERRAAALG